MEPTDIHRSLGPRAVTLVNSIATRIALPAGADLFNEGETGDFFCFVLTGTLGVYQTNEAGDRVLIGLIQPGETVGEMALLSEDSRSATVSAIRDCELLKLTKQQFFDLVEVEPRLLMRLARLLTVRLGRMARGEVVTTEPHTLAILPASIETDTRKIAQRLCEELEAVGFSAKLVGAEALQYAADWFDESERSHDYVIFAADLANPAWSKLCARRADRIMTLADAARQPLLELPTQLFQERAAYQLVDLVVLHTRSRQTFERTNKWLKLVPANRVFHLRTAVAADWARLARVVSGQGVGLVLSGGGARAYAHIGVYKALHENNIPIDFVGGTSMGAIVAAGIAMGWRPDELIQRVRDAFVLKNPLNDYTIPILSLVKGKRVDALLREHFGDLDIPDLRIPFFCVAANLTTGRPHIHRNRKVRHALRASIALPGILPPFVHPEGILCDGSAMCNLPVELMCNMCRGTIIAVDAARNRAIHPDAVRDRISGSFFSRLRQPLIASILMRAATISSEETDRRQGKLADLLLTPPLEDIEIKDWKAFDSAVEIGYHHTLEALASYDFTIAKTVRPESSRDHQTGS